MFNIFKKKNYRFNTINNNGLSDTNNINNSLFNNNTITETIIDSRHNTNYRPTNNTVAMDTSDDIINIQSKKNNRHNLTLLDAMDTSDDNPDVMNIKNKTKVSSVGALEMEIKFLKKEIQTLKRDIMYKNNYILTIKNKYDIELEYYRNKIITEYETIIYELNDKNTELERYINKLKYDIQDLDARLINTNSNYNLLCSICMTNTKNICLEPCNHLCICEKCILDYKLEHCPICRHTISKTKKIYL
jgi:predicted RNase H-like nuclease (RuvC/YqgF family)